MSYEIALVNPRAKPARKSKPKRRGAAMAKRRRRKMSAKQAKYFGKRRKRRSFARRKSSGTAVVVHANPRRKRRRSNPRVIGRHRRRRSNPRMGGIVGDVMGTVVPAGIGAAGVLAVDRVLGMVNVGAKVSANATTQKHINRAVRLVAVAGIGVAGRKFLGNDQGSKIGAAAMGIALHGLLSGFIGTGAGLSGELDGDPLGAYLQGEMDGDWQPTPGTVISGELDGELDGDDIRPLISGDMDGYDPLGEDVGADDLIGAYLQGDND